MVYNENIYRTNGFRILGLNITSKINKINNRMAKIEHYRNHGDFNDNDPLNGVFDRTEMNFLLPVKPEPSYNEYQDARNRLYNVETRLIDEIFWFWPITYSHRFDEKIVEYLNDNNFNKAIRCWENISDNNPLYIISIHNLAVIYHVRALDGFLEGKGNKNLFNDLEVSLNYWSEIINSDEFKIFVQERVHSINDPRLNDDFVDQIFNDLPENLLNIIYVFIKKILYSEKIGKRKEDYALKFINSITNSPFDKSIKSKFYSKIINSIDLRIKEYKKPIEKSFKSAITQSTKNELIIEYSDNILPLLNILHNSFNEDIISNSILNDSCDFIYYKIPTASRISSLENTNEYEFNKFIEILGFLKEFTTEKDLLKKIVTDYNLINPSKPTEYTINLSVLDDNGNSLNDVNITLTDIDTNKSYTVSTDSTGNCMDNLPSGNYYYKAEKKGYETDEGKKKIKRDTDLKIILKKKEKEVPKEFSLNISVYDNNENSLSNVDITLTDKNTNSTYNISTGNEGNCKINRLAEGEYYYNAQKSGYEYDSGIKNIKKDSNLRITLKKEKSDEPEISEFSYTKKFITLLGSIILISLACYAITYFI